MRPSVLARFARAVVRTCLKPALQPALPVTVQRAWAAIATRTLAVPFGVRFAASSLHGVPAQRVQSRSGADGTSAVLFLHGGAYLLGSPTSHRSITGRLAKLTGATVFVPDYRLAPEHPFPAALDDALASYRAMLAQGFRPDRIVVAGDSAGGGLALALLLRLRDAALPQPAGLALISPWADMTLAQLADIDGGDALLRRSWLEQGAKAYLQGRSAREPLASALFGDLAGLPPTLLQAAEGEILRNDSRRLAQALNAVGVPVTHREFPHMWHDFQLYAGIVPEATQAVQEMARFIRVRIAPAATQVTPASMAVLRVDRRSV